MCMEFSKIISLIAAGVAVYFYKQSSELKEQNEREKKAHEDYVNELLQENEELQDKIDPNVNSYQSPVIFTAAMCSGGQMLENNEITLYCTNPTDSIIELADFQARIWIAGYMANLCIPANLVNIRIPANKTVSFRLYAKYGQMFTNYNDVKRALNVLYDGKNQSTMRKETFIPLSKSPVVMNIQYLWVGRSFEDECYAYDVPGSYRWKFAGWTHGADAGYNAGKEREVEKNPSHWNDVIKIDE